MHLNPAGIHEQLGVVVDGKDAAEALLALGYLMAGCLATLTDYKYEEEGLEEAIYVLAHAYKHICSNADNIPTH